MKARFHYIDGRMREHTVHPNRGETSMPRHWVLLDFERSPAPDFAVDAQVDLADLSIERLGFDLVRFRYGEDFIGPRRLDGYFEQGHEIFDDDRSAK